MLVLKYLLTIFGVGFIVGAAGILAYDLMQIFQQRKLREGESQAGGLDLSPGEPQRRRSLRWNIAGKLALLSLIPLLPGLSITLVPSGMAGVRISQFGGARPGTLYPGVHGTIPLIESVELYNLRDSVYATSVGDEAKKKGEGLSVQTREGLSVGLAVGVRYRLDPSKLHTIHTNLPHPVEKELVPPVVASVFREIAPNYMVREMFATKREDIRREATNRITQRLAADGIVVKEVLLRDILLPAEYAKGLEGLLLKEQENERLTIDLDVKLKMVRSAELEAEALKIREIKHAEGAAGVRVLQAKAEADAMQHTLPLKEKQIQQSRLEAEARKEATVKNAEALAQAKVIDSKAELEKRRLVTEGEQDRIKRIAMADADRMRLEAEVLKHNPLLIQKIIAERISDKVQIMMVPNDGKFFFANDVFKGMTAANTQ
jgi:regulator of protease activity HflC (stomatin/prohibitin superfamily)